jgi:hypothetical protein
MCNESSDLRNESRNLEIGLKSYLDEYAQKVSEQHKLFDKCLDYVLKNMVLTHSEADFCAHCDASESRNHSLLPVPVETAEGTKDVWLHAGCIEGWNRERTEDAFTELAGLGIEPPFGFNVGRRALRYLIRAAMNEIVRRDDCPVDELNTIVRELKLAITNLEKKHDGINTAVLTQSKH